MRGPPREKPRAGDAGLFQNDRSGGQIEAKLPEAHQPAQQRHPHVLHRETFTTSRALDFCSERELTKQIGHPSEDWPMVIPKELIDNSLDACEEADIAPKLHVAVRGNQIILTDNGPGIPAATIDGVIDFNTRTSSREAYVSPTRGAQGNALKTIVAMGFALDRTRGETLIESHGVAHRIVFGIDPVRQEPRVVCDRNPSDIKNGTRITVHWPDSSGSKLLNAKPTFLQMAQDYGWLNPHLSLALHWDDQLEVDFSAPNPAWSKWRPSEPTSAHWYDVARLRRLMGAYIARDHDLGREPRTVRDFVGEFRGFSGSAKQKIVLEETGTARQSLEGFFGTTGVAGASALLAAMKRHSRPVEPKLIGLIGEDHLAARFKSIGADPKTFKYRKALGVSNGVPDVIEAAFAWLPENIPQRRIIIGVNWSVAIGNPFRTMAPGTSLDSILQKQRVGADEPVILVLHLARPRIEFSDHGKSAISLAEGDNDE
jgi:DNA topoisomerase VI subunit B